jgi:hypothetical protein
MPAQAGIQEFENGNNLKDLDSRCRGNETLFPSGDTISQGSGQGER